MHAARRHLRLSRLALGTLTLLILVGACFLVFSGLTRSIFSNRGKTVEAVFATSGLMFPGSPVRVHGVAVGTVTKLTLDPGGRTTTVQMGITDRGALPLYRDATAQIKWRTLLGANYVVDLSPGTRTAGELDPAVIPLNHTAGQVELDQILAALQTQQRQGLHTLLSELPRALSDPTAPANALTTLAQASPTLSKGLAAARGERPGDLQQLVTNTASTVQALDTTIPTLRDVVEGGAATVATTAARQSDIQTAIQLGAAVLPRVNSTASELNNTLNIADPLLGRLLPTAPQVAPTVAQLLPTVVSANTLLNQATPLLRSLRPAVAALAVAAHQGRPLLDQLAPSLDLLANRVLPDLAKPYSGSRHPTYEMIGPTLANLDAAAANLDSVSHFVTLTAGGGERALDTLPCRSYLFDPSAPQLVQCETALQVLQGLLGYLPPPTGAKK